MISPWVSETPPRKTPVTWLSASLALTRKSAFSSSSCRGSATRTHPTVGGVLSIFMAGVVNVAVLPALSVTVIVAVTALPSVVNVTGLAVVLLASTPDAPSPVVNAIETSVLFHPAAFAAGLGAPNVTVGGVLSTWTDKVLGASALLALSRPKYVSVVTPLAEMGTDTTLPLFVLAPAWAPLSEKLISFTPEPPVLSVAVSVTLTSLLFQPFGFAPGARDALVLGAVVSANAVRPGPSAMLAPPTTSETFPALARMLDVVGSTDRLAPSSSVAVTMVPSAPVNVQPMGPVRTSSVGVEQWKSNALSSATVRVPKGRLGFLQNGATLNVVADPVVSVVTRIVSPTANGS